MEISEIVEMRVGKRDLLQECISELLQSQSGVNQILSEAQNLALKFGNCSPHIQLLRTAVQRASASSFTIKLADRDAGMFYLTSIGHH